MLSNNDNDQLLSKPHGIEEQGVKSTRNLAFLTRKMQDYEGEQHCYCLLREYHEVILI